MKNNESNPLSREKKPAVNKKSNSASRPQDSKIPVQPGQGEGDKTVALSRAEIEALKENLEELNRSNALGG